MARDGSDGDAARGETAGRTPLRVALARSAGASDLPLPARATSGSSGYDLRAAIERDVEIGPGERLLIPTGLSIAVPLGYEAQVRPRSGLALEHGIVLPNAPGTIDSDYRGEIKVILMNAGTETFTVRRGDRIAQLVIGPVANVAWEEVPALDPTPRGAGGFGHTGHRDPSDDGAGGGR